MQKPFIETDGETLVFVPYNTLPIEGYEKPTNEETGKEFPHCCPYHTWIYENSVKWFSEFPNCCDGHKAFVKKPWFKKELYNGITDKIVRQVNFTEHHIQTQATKSDWYKDITDYIDWTIFSFGHPAVGLHIYLQSLRHYIQTNAKELNDEQRKQLLSFLQKHYETPKEQGTDFNILYQTYQQWLKVFPFGLNSYFGHLKEKFEKQFPILNGKPEINKYSGTARVKLHTKESLIEALLNLTNSLLTQINGATLYEKALITDASKMKLELVIESRKMKLAEGYLNKSKSEEQRYRKILKEWIRDEKRFFEEITPLLKELPAPTKKPAIEEENENDFIMSTIEDWLYSFKQEEHLSEKDYEALKNAYFTYSQTGKFPTLEKPIQIRGKVNLKRFGWALHEILSAQGKAVTVEVLEFSQKYISIFNKYTFDKNDYLKSNIYNYHNTKTK